jgi:hypothetical protein
MTEEQVLEGSGEARTAEAVIGPNGQKESL